MGRILLCVFLAGGALLRPSMMGRGHLQDPAAQPDIVIILTDQQQADAMSITGRPGINTPTMDQLAREGVRFTRAFCATPQCSPSRAALMTGRYPHRAGVMSNTTQGLGEKKGAGMSPPLSTTIPSLGKVFSDAGYRTAYFGKWHLGGEPDRHGFAVTDRFLGDERLTGQVVSFMKRREGAAKRRPLLMVASWLNPHDIYSVHRNDWKNAEAAARVQLPASLTDDLFKKPFPQRHFLEEDQGKSFKTAGPDVWRRYIAYYNHLMEEVDKEIGRAVREIRAANPNTLIVFSSDHGDTAGAHRLPFKSPAMYDELIRVPLMVTWPGRISPAVSDALVHNADILPTLCDLAGVPPPEGVDGQSLRPLLGLQSKDQTRELKRWRDTIFLQYHGKQDWRVPIRTVRTADWKYNRYLRYGEELYDLKNDPHEMNNLAASSQHAARKKELSGRLDEWISATKDPFNTLTVTDRQGKVLPPEGTAALSPAPKKGEEGK